MSVVVTHDRNNITVLVDDTLLDEGEAHITLYRTSDTTPGVVLTPEEALDVLIGLTAAINYISDRRP